MGWLLQLVTRVAGSLGLSGASAPAPEVPSAPGVDVGTATAARSIQQLAVQVAATLCRRFEGCYLEPYLCPAGVPTIGYGATHYEDGRAVRLNDPAITRERAEALLLWHLEHEYLPAVLLLCPGVTDPDKLAALVDFTFNLGAGQLRASTLRRRVNAGQWDQVPTELRKWVNAAGRPLRGLVLRREAEVVLVLKT